MLKFIKSLLGNQTSDKPEDYSNIYFRWQKEGQEYGPYDFEYILIRKWSDSPLEGRFENESKWRDYSYFKKILDTLKISERQIKEMTKLGITKIDTNMTLNDAAKIIELKHEERRLQREKEKVDKSEFPATKQTIKKLRELGIAFSENITRSQAKELISKHKDKEYLTEIFSFLKKNNVEFIEKLSVDTIMQGSDANLPTIDQLDELYTTVQPFLDSGIEIDFPNSLNKDEMKIFNERLSDAESEVDDIEVQLTTYHKIAIGDNDYKVSGELPEDQLMKIYSHVVRKVISGEWDSDKDLKRLLKQHLPELSLKKIDY